MTTTLSLIFFFSGASALIFELLWFHQTGLVFGNSIWATSTVLCSFMGGLAIGNSIAALKGDKVKDPILVYIILEITIAVTGYALVRILPELTSFFSSWFQHFSAHHIIINIIRGSSAFCLMLLPTTAMGATLPVLVKALSMRNKNFGNVLGLLYGWNTLGAVAGVLLAEIVFIKFFGIRGAGLIAVSFNTTAILLSYFLWKKNSSKGPIYETRARERIKLSHESKRLLTASFLSGLTLLALEVIWFRFIILFFSSHSLNFTIMLAVVLAGISIGGLIAAQLFRTKQDIHRILPIVFLVNGTYLTLSYRLADNLLNFAHNQSSEVLIVYLSLLLIFPVSCLSGVIFTMLGRNIQLHIKSEAMATGFLTLTNTTGGMTGSVLAVLLIPLIGTELSFFLFALIYGCTAFILSYRQLSPQKMKISRYSLLIFLIVLIFFPFGHMENNYLKISGKQCLNRGEKCIAVREGLTETIQYYQKNLLGAPHYQTLITNNFAMSGTQTFAKRYMSLFVYWPVAVHPAPKNALLICFGCGITAKALTDTRVLEHIDIVDISKDILEMSSCVFKTPSTNPLYDPRVKSHIEDGRFFLQTTKKKYDLITAEPPPPASKGVANLYSQEYFQLIYDRLADNGIVTYWLPAHFLKTEEGKSILKGFCNVFSQSSLWIGSGFNFMMVGTKYFSASVSEKHFSRQWNDPVVREKLKISGFESPEQFGSLFVADGQRLQSWIADSLPLTDNYPQRVSYQSYKADKDMTSYRTLLNPEASKTNFINSDYISSIWPDNLRKKSLSYFKVREVINELYIDRRLSIYSLQTLLHKCVNEPLLHNYILWACLSDSTIQKIIEQTTLSETTQINLDVFLGLSAKYAQKDDYLSAEKYLDLASQRLKTKLTIPGHYNITLYRMYFLFISGMSDRAITIGQQYIGIMEKGKSERTEQIKNYWNWLNTVVSKDLSLTGTKRNKERKGTRP